MHHDVNGKEFPIYIRKTSQEFIAFSLLYLVSCDGGNDILICIMFIQLSTRSAVPHPTHNIRPWPFAVCQCGSLAY